MTTISTKPCSGNNINNTNINNNKPSKLESNLKLGSTINEYVQKKVPFILNYLERRDFDYTTFNPPTNMRLVEQRISMVFETVYQKVVTNNFNHRNIQKIAEVAKKVGIGTCLEMSAVALDYAICNKVPEKVELVYLKGGNHVFAVIERNQKSKPSNYKNWGKDCVVCDTWNGKVFPASQIESKLQNFVETKTVKDHIVTVVEPFNPKKHTPCLLKNFA